MPREIKEVEVEDGEDSPTGDSADEGEWASTGRAGEACEGEWVAQAVMAE